MYYLLKLSRNFRMKNYPRYLVFISMMFSSSLLLAQRAGLTFGVSQVQVAGDTGIDVSSSGSYQLGALFYQPMAESFEVRVGALLHQQSLTVTASGNDTTLNLSNVNVPLTAGYKFGERFLIFAGPVLSVNANKSCKSTASCSMSSYKVKGTDVLLSLGGQAQLTESIGLEVSYDRMNGKPFEGTTGGQMINVNFQYIIE